MYIVDTEKGSINIGSGYLYAIEAKNFTEDMDVAEMAEIGWIKDEATFTHNTEMVEISAANSDGVIAVIPGTTTTEFDTGIISYNPEHVRRFLLGNCGGVEGGVDVTNFGRFRRPEVALVFVGTDKDNGKEMQLVMPRCVWVGEYQLNFNNNDPIELNYHFKCLRYKKADGTVCSAYRKQAVDTAE